MAKKRTLSINTQVSQQEVDSQSVVNKVSPLEQLNRYLTPDLKYTLNEFINKFPDKSERIVAHANLSDEALLGYIKTLIVAPIQQPLIVEQTEEE